MLAKRTFFFAGLMIVGGFHFLVVVSTYFYSDDFTLMFESSQHSNIFEGWFRPIFGHFVPGMLALYWLSGQLDGLGRIAAACLVSFFACANYLLLCSLARKLHMRDREDRYDARIYVSAIVASFAVLAPISTIYMARGFSTFPFSSLTLLAVVLGIKGAETGNAWLWRASALSVSIGYLFWELALLNVVFVPLLVRFLSDLIVEDRLRDSGRLRRGRTGARSFLSFIVLPTMVYVWFYLTRGFGSGVAAPKIPDLFRGVLSWVWKGFVPVIGGGPIPNGGQVLGTHNGDISTIQILVPLVLGMGTLAGALSLSRLRPLTILVLLVSLSHGLLILYGRIEFSGSESVALNLRYHADLLPYLQIWLLVFCLFVLRRDGWQSRSIKSALTIVFSLSLVCSGASWSQFVKKFGGSERRSYVFTAIDSVRQAPSHVLLLSGPASPVLGWTPIPWDHLEALFYAEIGGSRWRAGDKANMMLIDRDGVLQPVAKRDYVRLSPVENLPCTYWRESATVEVSSKAAFRTLEVLIRSEVQTSIELQIVNEFVRLNVVQGTNSFVYQTYGGTSDLIILNPEASGACIESASSFIAEAVVTDTVPSG